MTSPEAPQPASDTHVAGQEISRLDEDGLGVVREQIGMLFQNGALSVRAPVTISGVKVGSVSTIELDETLRARVTIDVDASLELPVDSSAGIRTSGILGDQFIALDPGAEDLLLAQGEQIEFVEDAFNLEKLIGALVHGTGDDE